jgi:hypothetical protein
MAAAKSRLTHKKTQPKINASSPLAELLKSKSREDLVTLIGKMLEKEPSLFLLLETSSIIQLGKPINLSVYQKQIDRAFVLRDMYDIADALRDLVDAASDLHESGDWHNGGQLYQLLLEESINVYDDDFLAIDHDGDIASVIQDMTEGLADCLGEVENIDQTIRESWLQTLLDGKLKDIDLGGMCFAEGAWEGILEHANEEEWIWIKATIRQKIQVSQGQQWQREQLVHLLTEKANQAGDQGTEQNIIEELGSPKQKVFLWVEQGKWDAAIALAKKEFTTLPGLAFELADKLLEANLPELALEYVLGEQKKGGISWRDDDWLEDYYCKFGTTAEATEWSMKGFGRLPNLARYLKLKELHPKKRVWNSLQKELFQQLEEKRSYNIWIDIMLAEDSLDRAIALLEKLSPYNRLSKLVQVAKIAEKEKPQAAIGIYQMVVTDFIASKNRSAYQNSVTYLKIIRSLYESTKQQSHWTSYISTLRTTYPTLRALQEELSKAKL